MARETRLRIDRCMQLSRVRALALQTISMMDREELNLLRANLIPSNLEEALHAQSIHGNFQHAMEVLFHFLFSGFYASIFLIYLQLTLFLANSADVCEFCGED